MHKSILLLFLALTLIGSCKPKETPNPQGPSQTDTTDTEPIDSLSDGFNENVMPKHLHDGTIGKSITSHDGNILALGTDASGNPVIWKINITNGNVIWVKEIADQDHVFTGITETNDADIVVSGYKNSNYDSLVVRAYNSAGDVKWRKAFGETDHSHGFSQIVSLNNSTLLIYNYSSFHLSSNNVRLQKLLLDEDGNKISGVIYSSNMVDQCTDLIKTNNNGKVGVFNRPPVPFRINHFNENGDIFNTAVASGQVVQCRAVKEAPNGDLLCCGSDGPISGAGYKGFVARFSSGFDNLDHDQYPNVYDFKNITATGVGFIAVGASITNHTYMMGCNHSGTVLWEKICPAAQGTTEYANNIFKSGSYYVVVGNCSTNKFFVMGVDEDGAIHP